MPIKTIDSYRAVALQLNCHTVHENTDVASSRKVMRGSIDRLSQILPANLQFIGKDCKLVVLPEYWLTGFPMGISFQDWISKAAIEDSGIEVEGLAKIASDNQVYLSFNAYEKDSYFENLFFQASYILNPSGEICLKHRRMNSLFSPTPFDVWDKYLEVYGYESLFPVAETEIGKLAAIPSDEIFFPEVTRCLAMRGAEIFVHNSSEIFSNSDTKKMICKRSRAIENNAYVVSANTAKLLDQPILNDSANGGSCIINYEGKIVADTTQGESMAANAEIDLAALKRARSRPGMDNLLARQKFQLYAASYENALGNHPNSLKEGVGSRADILKVHLQSIQNLLLNKNLKG